MTGITIEWLVGMLRATTLNRDHGANLGALKSFYDEESNRLRSMLTAVVGGAFSLSAALGVAIYTETYLPGTRSDRPP